MTFNNSLNLQVNLCEFKNQLDFLHELEIVILDCPQKIAAMARRNSQKFLSFMAVLMYSEKKSAINLHYITNIRKSQ